MRQLIGSADPARTTDDAGSLTRRSLATGAAGLVGASLLSPAPAQAGPSVSSVGAYRFASVTNGTEDETLRLAAFLASVPDGAIVELRGRWLLGGQVELCGRSDVTIDGRGATIMLAVRGWNDRAALVVRDCHRTTVRDIIFNCAGKAFVAAGLADKAPTALAVISTAATAAAEEKRSSDIEVDCTFLDMAQRGLGIRLVDGVRVRGRFSGRARASTSFCDIARSDRIDLVPDSASDAPFSELGGSDYVVSPGSFYVAAPDAEFSFEAAINWCGLTHYEKPFEATAPSGPQEWTLDFRGGDATMPDGHDYRRNSWFFTCIDDAGAEDIRPEQLQVSVLPGTRRAVIRLVDLDGRTPRSFKGQRFRITSIATSRFCRSIRVHGGTMRNSSGAGVMLMGCDGISVAHCVTENCFDYGIDLEWSINGAVTGNTIRNTIRTNGGIGVLFFFRNITIVGNVVNNRINTDAAISAFGSGQANTALMIVGNVIEGGAIRLGSNDQAWFTGEDVLIDGNSVSGATIAVFVRGAPDRLACARHVRISNCRFSSIGQQPLLLLSVTDVAIVGNDVHGTLYRGLCNIEGSAGLNRRIHVADCTVRGSGYGWVGLPMILYQGPASAAPAITQHNNWIADEGLAVGLDRPFYQAGDGAIVTALRRGEVRVPAPSRTVAAGDTLEIEVEMPHARSGQPLVALLLAPAPSWVTTVAATRAGSVRLTIINLARNERRLQSEISITPA